MKLVLLLFATTLAASAQAPDSAAAARSQIGQTVTYDPAYAVLKYPGGDVHARLKPHRQHG